MSYTKTSRRKYDKKSIQIRKELEELSKKSKDEYKSMEAEGKAEILLKEGMARTKILPEKYTVCSNEERKLHKREANSGKERNLNELLTTSGVKDTVGSHAKEFDAKSTGKSDLKSKIPAGKKDCVENVVSDFSLGLQGKSVHTKKKEEENLLMEEDDLYDLPDMFLHYDFVPSFHPPEYAPAKFAITTSQNTSMPVVLTARKPHPKTQRTLKSATSNTSQHEHEEEEFSFAWSSDSGSRTTLVDGENKTSYISIDEKEQQRAGDSNEVKKDEKHVEIISVQDITSNKGNLKGTKCENADLKQDFLVSDQQTNRQKCDIDTDATKPDEEVQVVSEKQDVFTASNDAESPFDDEKANQALCRPLEVTASDIVNVSGTKAPIISRVDDRVAKSEARKKVSSLDQKQRGDSNVKPTISPNKRIHHFCSHNDTAELSAELARVSRDHHTIDKYKAVASHYHTPEDPIPVMRGMFSLPDDMLICSKHDNVDSTEHANVERRISQVAEQILNDAIEHEDALERLKKAANEMFSESEDITLNIKGTKIDLKDDSTRFHLTPAPPKLHLTPAYIRNQMIPDYQGAPVVRDTLGADFETVATTNEDSDNEDDDLDKISPEDANARDRVLQRQHGSLSNIIDQLSRKPKETPRQEKRPSDSRDQSPSEKFMSVLDVRRQMAKIRYSLRPEESSIKLPTTLDDDQLFKDLKLPKRPHSQPVLERDVGLCVDTGFDTSMQELEEQVTTVSQIKETKMKLGQQEEEDGEVERNYKVDPINITVPIVDHTGLNTASTKYPVTTHGKSSKTQQRKTKTDELSEDERTRRRKEMKKHLKEFLNEPPRSLIRSESLDVLQDTRSIKRSPSLPCILDHGSLCNDEMPVSDLFEWVQDNYWYKWLDLVYPPSSVAGSDDARDLDSRLSAEETAIFTPDILDEIEIIQPNVDEASQEIYENLETEIGKLTTLIDETQGEQSRAIYLSRRGAIHRKLGFLKKAWDDLDRSIQLEPNLVESYWHRHLLFLLKDKPKKALDDLAFIIKRNRNLVKAYRSRAEIYKDLGDSTMAIVNYTQAIKLEPNEAETYYRRAAMFENRGDTILALEDYQMASKILPSRTEAIFNIGIYNFNQKNWQAAIRSFTNMLKQDPLNATAYLYRGKAFSQQNSFDEALKDLSRALHLSPASTEAFYQRGCLLRKVHPQKALQDLSVSLLLDSTMANVKAFLHRAIIYTDLKRWDEATSDFDAALKLDKCIPSAHVNVGLIMITKHNNYPRAIKRFTAAIRVDPTYIRGYICRAEAYEKVRNLKESINDYTRAIHLRPDNSDYRISRGKVLLKQNKLDLASFHITQSAELSLDIGKSPTQQAVVHAFLKNYDQAIDILTRATRITPTAPMFILLGKICMKAKTFENAIASFKRSIYILTPWHPRAEMPKTAAAVYFMLGTCYTELKDLPNALDSFNSAIKVEPNDAEAYYQRGLTKMKLRQAKSIHDFNRALAINPKLFQAFLSRAAYYGLKGRYSKGIMNCNEAIKLQPRSVRAYLYRGALKFHISAYKLAVRDLTEAIAIDCTCYLAYFNRAVCYQAMKYYQKALIDYSTVLLTSKDNDFKVLQNRGLLYLDINDVENALKDFTEASKVSPNNPKVLHTLGLCYHKMDRLENAVKSYTEALNIDPFFTEAYIARGNALMDFGHLNATRFARADYMKAIHINPLCLRARVNLAYNLQVENKFQQAWNQFTSSLKIDNQCQAALEGRAIVNLQMSNTFGAFVDMNDCIKISKTAELLTNRGVVHQFMKDTVNAMKDYQTAIRLDPAYSLAFYNAGNLYFKQRQFKQALDYFKKASDWDPKDESAILNAAITKVMLKQYEEALDDFQKAIKLSPYSAHIYFNRGNLYAVLGDFENAESDYTYALQLHPGDALTYKRRADVRGRLSRRDEAIEDYKKAIIIQTSQQAQPTPKNTL